VTPVARRTPVDSTSEATRDPGAPSSWLVAGFPVDGIHGSSRRIPDDSLAGRFPGGTRRDPPVVPLPQPAPDVPVGGAEAPPTDRSWSARTRSGPTLELDYQPQLQVKPLV
jgi:hypothetical protein